MPNKQEKFRVRKEGFTKSSEFERIAPDTVSNMHPQRQQLSVPTRQKNIPRCSNKSLDSRVEDFLCFAKLQANVVTCKSIGQAFIRKP